MNRSMFTQSGELVTISRLKIKEKWKFLRSLRFRITVILVIIGIVPCVILEKSIVNSYEDRAVSVRSITVKNQCDIICNQLIQQNYMEDPGSDVINGQLSMLTNIYGGRILIIDQDFRVIKDTYDMDRRKDDYLAGGHPELSGQGDEPVRPEKQLSGNDGADSEYRDEGDARRYARQHFDG